ncbi:fungal-specific transcription factor domain-containing protein [Nemania abortiva]|nr:fungal-specific transcription factor domain-containing protein [Nemania abortiva]
MPFFLSRMDKFLQTVSPRLQLDSDLDVFTRAATSPSGTRSPPPPVQLANCVYPQQCTVKGSANAFLSRVQENLFLDLFWQTHYFSFPILNEGQFRREYKTLWDDSPGLGPRKPSPLVDIVIALCVQLGGFLVRQRSHGSDPGSTSSHDQRQLSHHSNPSLGGFQYYRRCQDAIDQITESPSIYTVQCFIFSIVYLYEAGLVNSAHVVAGKAIMMAMILGLPNEPQADEPEPQKEVARRTWWSLYILDVKLSLEIGRPPMIGPSHSTCQLPSDLNDVARWLGPHYSFDDSCPTWLGFQTQTLRLLDAVLSVRSVFFTKYDSIVGVNGYKDFVSNTTAREECAFLLTERMKDLNTWAKQVPAGYLVARQHGQSFSIDRAPLMFEAEMIIHCQRQRLLLELQYHEYCMSLYQPFICFASSVDESTPVSDTKAAAALAHAMTLTSMIHQTLTSTEVLSGIYHVFRWQKNALFTMLGFAYTFPINGSATATRKSIDMAITVVEMYRDVLPEAGPIAAIGRALSEHVGAFIMDIGTGGSSWSSLPSTSSAVAPVAASDAQTVGSSLLVPADSAPVQQDWNMMDMTMMPSSMDKMLGRSALNELSGEVANIETADTLWPGLVSGDVPNADWWISMGDSIT